MDNINGTNEAHSKTVPNVQLHSLSGTLRHKHGPKCKHMLKHILHPDEEILLETKQSYLEAFTPVILVATNKRLIIVYPSFIGYYLGYDLIHPTTYAIMPYKYIIGVSISKGKILSSLKIHTSGSIDIGSQVKDENEVHGIPSQNAILMTNVLAEILQFTEEEHKKLAEHKTVSDDNLIHREITSLHQNKDSALFSEHRSHSLIPEVTLAHAKDILKKNNSIVLWLGIESNLYISKLIDIDHKQIKKINLQDIERYKNDDIIALEGAILLSYDGIMSMHLAELFRDKYGILTYVLKGGIYSVIKSDSDETNYENFQNE